MCDFELGFHKTFSRIFGDDVIVGCLFHLGQCVYRKVQELGLSELYLQEEEVRVRCKMLVALAFVPVRDVVAACESLVEDIPDELIPLIDYFADTWTGRLGRQDQRRNLLFPIRLWSIYDRVVLWITSLITSHVLLHIFGIRPFYIQLRCAQLSGGIIVAQMSARNCRARNCLARKCRGAHTI